MDTSYASPNVFFSCGTTTIFHTKRQNSDSESFERPSQQLARNRLLWIGHVLRSDDIVLREVLTFVPESGARRRGRPRLRFYDTLKADLADRNIVLPARSQDDFWSILQEKTADRTNWQKIVKWRR